MQCMFVLVHNTLCSYLVTSIRYFTSILWAVFYFGGRGGGSLAICEHWGAILTVAIAACRHQQQTAWVAEVDPPTHCSLAFLVPPSSHSFSGGHRSHIFTHSFRHATQLALDCSFSRLSDIPHLSLPLLTFSRDSALVSKACSSSRMRLSSLSISSSRSCNSRRSCSELSSSSLHQSAFSFSCEVSRSTW